MPTRDDQTTITINSVTKEAFEKACERAFPSATYSSYDDLFLDVTKILEEHAMMIANFN